MDNDIRLSRGLGVVRLDAANVKKASLRAMKAMITLEQLAECYGQLAADVEVHL